MIGLRERRKLQICQSDRPSFRPVGEFRKPARSVSCVICDSRIALSVRQRRWVVRPLRRPSGESERDVVASSFDLALAHQVAGKLRGAAASLAPQRRIRLPRAAVATRVAI